MGAWAHHKKCTTTARKRAGPGRQHGRKKCRTVGQRWLLSTGTSEKKRTSRICGPKEKKGRGQAERAVGGRDHQKVKGTPLGEPEDKHREVPKRRGEIRREKGAVGGELPLGERFHLWAPSQQ